MIENKQDFIFYISEDMNRIGITRGWYSFFKNPIFRFTVLLRFNEYLFNTNTHFILTLIPLLWFKRISIRLGFSIPLNVFDSGLAIVHYGLLIVNEKARIGKNCRIHAGVNIGASAGFKIDYNERSYAPIIGDNCYIGPGAKLFGPITIGNNCVIGANAVVNKGFLENNVTIAGIPAKIVSQKSSKGLILNEK